MITINPSYQEILSDKDFRRLSEFIYRNYGIKMPLEKKTMLEGRPTKRLKATRMNSFSEYCDYVFSEEGMEYEIIHMIDVVSTNKTDFFRESAHFEFLNDTILPEFASNGVSRPMRVWSAASSSGEEPYTISMVISEYNRTTTEPVQFSVFGT